MKNNAMKLIPTIFALLITAVLGGGSEFECYSCEKEKGILDMVYISQDCTHKVKCDTYCVDVTFTYTGLSYRKRGCIELINDSTCNSLWSDCLREVCSENLCNGGTAAPFSGVLLLTSILLTVTLVV